MCESGNVVILKVPIPENLSYTGKFRWAEKGIDKCIAPIVQALNDAGIYTANSCCGHGINPGNIILHDGRELIIGKRGTVTDRTIYEKIEFIMHEYAIKIAPLALKVIQDGIAESQKVFLIVNLVVEKEIDDLRESSSDE